MKTCQINEWTRIDRKNPDTLPPLDQWNLLYSKLTDRIDQRFYFREIDMRGSISLHHYTHWRCLCEADFPQAKL